jgi:peroxiredoxin
MPLNSPSAYMLQVKMVSDPNGGFAYAVDLEAPGTSWRASQRYAGIVQDGIPSAWCASSSVTMLLTF